MTVDGIDMIVAALDASDPAAAERHCKVLLQSSPEDADVLVLLALSLWRQGRQEDALDIYARLTRLYVDDSSHWRNYATALRNAGSLEAAESASQTAVQLAPDDAELLEVHGLLQLQLGKPADACMTLLRAFGKNPDSPAVRIHAAQACVACRDLRADELLSPWRTWLPLEETLQLELADLQAQQGDAASAVLVLEDLVRRFPMNVGAKLFLASMYERVNQLENAETMLREIAASPVADEGKTQDGVKRLRAQLLIRGGDADAGRELLERIGPYDAKDDAYWFTLAKTCDKLGDVAATMHALEQAHARQLEELRMVTPQIFEEGGLTRVRARVGIADYRNWPNLLAPDESQSPVFVVGFPRSGTTLLEQMLDAHPRLQSMDERPLFNMLAAQLASTTEFEIPRDLGKLSQCDCDELRKGYLILACGKVPRHWDARLVDKNPLNMLWLPMIYRLFPHAKFILALRHPCDVILSCYMQSFRAPMLAYAGQSFEELARSYVTVMESWLYHVEVFAPDVFISRYEDLIADTPSQTRRITEFLGLADAETMLRFDARAREKGYIRTPSYTQVIEPINTRGIGRWQRYRPFMESALPILKPMLEHWGYQIDPVPTPAQVMK